jgi:hypothetical protein
VALEATRAKATLDADTSGFRRNIAGAQQAMEQFGQSTGKVSSVVGAAMSFATGFGIVTAIRQAQSFWDSLVTDMEDSASRLSRGAGGGERAQDFRRRAARLRGEAADPFRFISPIARLLGTGVAGSFAQIGEALGSEGAAETNRQLKQLRDEQKQHLLDLINSSNTEAEGLERLAANMEAQGRGAAGTARGLIGTARGVGLGNLADQLESAIVEGVVDTITDLTVKIRQEIAARVQERAVYDDFLR